MTFKRCLLLFMIAFSGVTTTAVSTYFLYVNSHKEHTEQFSHKTIPYFGAVSSNLQKSLDQVAAVQAYFQSAASVSREQFSTFASTLIAVSSGIQAIEWVPRVPHDRRAALESAAQFHGFTDFSFLEKAANAEMVVAAERQEYYPVYYIEPFVENKETFGLDLASNPTRKEAMEASRDSGEVVISRRMTLVQEPTEHIGVLAFEPVYRRDLPSQSVADRRESVKGFVIGVFHIGDIVDEALKILPPFVGARIQIFDRSASTKNDILYESQKVQSDQFENPDNNSDTVSYQIDLPDKNSKWEIVFSQAHLYSVWQMNGVTWFTLIVGLLMTTMMTVIVAVYMNRATVTTKLVEERTKELKTSEKKAIRMAAEAEHSQREAEIANGAKSNFLATMSHEIRTPLNGVLGMAQLPKNSKLDTDQGEKVETILSSGRTLLAIINDVLDMSKIEAGGIELELTAFSLSNLISSVSTPFQSLADDKGVLLKVSDTTDALDALKGDPVRLRQVIWNLLSNAIKFTQEGQVTLSFSIVEPLIGDEGQSKDTAVRISIADTGTGISEERMPYIFDAFTQEDTSITRKFGGSGLGLSIVKRLVDLMGGSITAKSGLDEGTCFTVTLPFDLASEEESKRLIHNSQPSTITGPASRLKILLA